MRPSDSVAHHTGDLPAKINCQRSTTTGPDVAGTTKGRLPTTGAGDAWTKDSQIAQYVKSLGVDRKKWMNASQAEHEAWIKQAGEKAKAAGLSKSGYKAPGLEGGRSRSYHTLVDHIGRLLELEK